MDMAFFFFAFAPFRQIEVYCFFTVILTKQPPPTNRYIAYRKPMSATYTLTQIDIFYQ